MSKVIKCVVATLLMSCALWSSATGAQAGQTRCTLGDVEFWAVVPMLRFSCANDPGDYRAYYTPSSDNCPTLSADQVKTWTSMLTAAYISGKIVTVNWTSVTCPRGGSPFMMDSVDSIVLSP